MEKEQILSEMVAKLGKTSLSQRTISGYVEGNLPTALSQTMRIGRNMWGF